MSLHIFWDNSNVLGSAQEIRRVKEPQVPWVALRVHFANLYEIVRNGRDVVTKVMSGSVPPECEELWDYARRLGFETNLLRRVSSEEGTKREQAVDEILHVKMANVVLDFELPQTMALLSGDSASSEYGTSFPSQVQRALNNGWDVEIYSAIACLSERTYAPIVAKFQGRLKIIELDPYYEQFTFVQGGEYYRKDADGHKIYFPVNDRLVKPI